MSPEIPHFPSTTGVLQCLLLNMAQIPHPLDAYTVLYWRPKFHFLKVGNLTLVANTNPNPNLLEFF